MCLCIVQPPRAWKTTTSWSKSWFSDMFGFQAGIVWTCVPAHSAASPGSEEHTSWSKSWLSDMFGFQAGIIGHVCLCIMQPPRAWKSTPVGQNDGSLTCLDFKRGSSGHVCPRTVQPPQAWRTTTSRSKSWLSDMFEFQARIVQTCVPAHSAPSPGHREQHNPVNINY